MEETQISITIKPIYFERLLYWIIIIALSVLLVMAFMKDEACNDEETAKQFIYLNNGIKTPIQISSDAITIRVGFSRQKTGRSSYDY